MPAIDAGDVLTVALAVLASVASWGATKQKVADLERRVGAAEGTRDEVIRLQEQVKALVEAMKDLRDDIRNSRQPRRKAEVAE